MAGQRYRTIVADPPWPYPDDARGWGISIGRENWREGKGRRKTPYASMTLDAIKALSVASIAEDDAHLYVWTTNRHLHEAFHVAKEWGFRHAQTLVWAKQPKGGFLGGAYGANLEFVLFCRRGTLATKARVTTSWFEWPRNAVGSHSRKPEAFLDIVEQISPGPYLELFARRARLGWHTWGDEALHGTEAMTA